MRARVLKLMRMSTIAACGALTFGAITAAAQDLPGKGKTVRYAQSDSLGANYVTAQIMSRAMKELGYDVKMTTINTTLFFQAAAQGDLDIATDVNFPQREPGCEIRRKADSESEASRTAVR